MRTRMGIGGNGRELGLEFEGARVTSHSLFREGGDDELPSFISFRRDPQSKRNPLSRLLPVATTNIPSRLSSKNHIPTPLDQRTA